MTRIIFLPLLAPAACEGNPEAGRNNAAEVQNQLDAPVKEVETLPPDETAGADPAPVDQAASGRISSIPEPFRGRWGLLPADCTSTRGDAKGLLRIDDNRLYFYESRATLDRIIAASPSRFEADFGFGGEGQSWTAVQVLELNGNKLRRIDRSDQPVDLIYTRCR